MTLGYSDKILPHPAVEYIPLNIRTIIQKTDWSNSYPIKFYIFDNYYDAAQVLRSLDININKEINYKDKLLLLFLNAKVDDIFYRGYKVQMIGKINNNSIHFFTITDKYFYKNKLIFNFFLTNEEQLLKKTYQLN